jgi:uncharacterized protein YbjQ (UPF0145 family)
VREELPAVSAARLAEIQASGTWGSALTSGEFAAIRSAGFEPAGQVFGAAVFGVGRDVRYSCPGTRASSREVSPAQPPEQGYFGALAQAMNQARRTAVARMTAECAGLGADGVVGLRISRGEYVLGGHEFSAIGTAVRARGAASGERAPFTSDLSGQDFAKLIMAGWVPAALVLGLSVGACHDDWPTVRQTRRWSGNAEIAGWTEVVNESRRDARRQLERDVQRVGAEGVVIASMRMRVRERDCPAQTGRRDHVVEATLLGTAVARFSRTAGGSAAPAVAIMPLDPQRRHAARARE